MAARAPLTPPSDSSAGTNGTNAAPAYQDESSFFDSASENASMATDWSQWMRWDDFDRLSPSATSLGSAPGGGGGGGGALPAQPANGFQNAFAKPGEPYAMDAVDAMDTALDAALDPAAAAAPDACGGSDPSTGLQLSAFDYKPAAIDAYDPQQIAGGANGMISADMTGLLSPFIPNFTTTAAATTVSATDAGTAAQIACMPPSSGAVAAAVPSREFGSFSHDMVQPFAPAYSPEFANLKRHSIAVPAFVQRQQHQRQQQQQQQLNQQAQVPLIQQTLALRAGSNPTAPSAALANQIAGAMMPLPQQDQTATAETQSIPTVVSAAVPSNSLTPPLATKKRKSAVDLPATSCDAMTTISRVSPPQSSRTLPSKKRSHNVIEKRYRANLNEKIAELRDAVPALRIMARQRSRAGMTDGADDATHGIDADADDEVVGGANNKLNKASILSKATEYIRHLEARTKRLDEENVELKNRLRQLEKSADQGFLGGAAATRPTSDSGSHYADLSKATWTMNGNNSTLHGGMTPNSCTMMTDSALGGSPVFPDPAEHTHAYSPEASPNPLYPPEGLIKVPDYLRSMRPKGPQEHYADTGLRSQPRSNCTSRHESPDDTATDSTDSSLGSSTGGGSGGGGGGVGRFMLGTLAALMVVGLDEAHRDPDDEQDRGLIAIPGHYIPQGIRAVQGYLRATAGFGLANGSGKSIAGTLMAYAICLLGITIVLAYFVGVSRARRGKSASAAVAHGNAAAVGSIPEAVLSKVQFLYGMSHSTIPEWFNVVCRVLEYSARSCLGSNVYAALTGISDADEAARIKSWDAIVTAQLTGAGPPLSRGRLVLTAFAAGTLPRSPARLMLQALHARLALWRIDAEDSRSHKVWRAVAGAIANRQWASARRLHAQLPLQHQDRLPEHLALLLQRQCDEVLTDATVQRAMNLASHRATQEATAGDDAMLDMVADDASLEKPLDYIASWWSCARLQQTLLMAWESIECSSDCDDEDLNEDEHMSAAFEKGLADALAIAPPSSMSSIMARVMKAVFVDADRVANINTVLEILSRAPRQSLSKSHGTARQEHARRGKIAPSLISLYDITSPVPACIRVDLRLAVRTAMIIAILRRQVIQHAGQLIGIRGRVQLGGSTCSGRDPRLTVAGAVKAFNNLPVDAIELGLGGCAALWWALRVVAKEEHEASKADAAAARATSSSSSYSSGESVGSTLRNRSAESVSRTAKPPVSVSDGHQQPQQAAGSASPQDTTQPHRHSSSTSLSSISSTDSVASLTDDTTTSASVSDECVTPAPELEAEYVAKHVYPRLEQRHLADRDLEQQQLDNTIPTPDLRRIASRLAYWARHAYNPVSYGFTPSLNEKVVSDCRAICDSVEQAPRQSQARLPAA